MDNIEIHWIYAASGFFLGLILTATYFLQKTGRLECQNAELSAQIKAEKAAYDTASAALDQRFKVTAQEALKQSSESFLQLAKERLSQSHKDSAHELEKRQHAISEMVKPMQSQLENLNKAIEQVKGTDQALRQDLQFLSKETAKLAGALRNPSARGNWGEEMLERLLENSGLIKNVHYTLQHHMSDGQKSMRPDAVINMPDSLHIVIDSKAPISDLIHRLDDDLKESEYKEFQTGLARAVKSHIHDLSKKAYWKQLNSPDFVVLFLPSEHLFSAAIQADPALLDVAANNKIVLASPILVMSLLRVVGMSWRQVDLAKNAHEISERGADLYNRLLTFTSHIEKIGKNLQTAMNGYDAAVGSLEKKVLPAARKFKDLQAQSGLADLPEMEQIEKQPRMINLTSEDEDELKKSA